MALHMDLKVNGQRIGYLEAQRLTPMRPTGNDICRYSWLLNINGETRSNLSETPVEHRFGDGAWALVARVIEAAGRGSREDDFSAPMFGRPTVSDIATVKAIVDAPYRPGLEVRLEEDTDA